MTHRIYYTDSARTRFDATVLQVTTHDGRPAVILDRTAFYPSSGGQPFDTGRLGGFPVLDVVDLDDGEVAHVLAVADVANETQIRIRSDEPGDVVQAAVFPALTAEHRGGSGATALAALTGCAIRGEVDWARRFDHMQQHSGQHVLSAAFDSVCDARTVSFHLGADTATIDLARDVSPNQIARAEQEANRVVWDDGLVSIRFVSAGEAAALPLRKEPSREGTLRLIDMGGFDLSACGGTHVARTGAIGLIAVIAWEKFKGGSRVTFVCGGRALRAVRRYRDTVAGSIRLLSVSPGELPQAIERLQGESRDLRRSVKQYQEEAAAQEGRALAERAPVADGRRVIVEALDGWDANGLKALASAATSGDGVVAALFLKTAPVAAVIAVSKDVPVDASAILKALIATFGGRGGGKAGLAQGGGFAASVPDLLTAVRKLI